MLDFGKGRVEPFMLNNWCDLLRSKFCSVECSRKMFQFYWVSSKLHFKCRTASPLWRWKGYFIVAVYLKFTETSCPYSYLASPLVHPIWVIYLPNKAIVSSWYNLSWHVGFFTRKERQGDCVAFIECATKWLFLLPDLIMTGSSLSQGSVQQLCVREILVT